VTFPSFQPVDPEPGAMTEPVPTPPAPVVRPPFAAQSPGALPNGLPPFNAAAATPPVFTPVAPEGGYAVSGPAMAQTSTSRGSSGILNLALGAALLVAGVGIAFAVGRASAPAASNVAALGQPGAGGIPGGQPGAGGIPGGQPGAGGIPGGQPGADDDGNGNGGRGGSGDADGGLGLERGFGRFGASGLPGTVTSVSARSITIQLATGQLVTFKLDGATTYRKTVSAAASDVTTGAQVQVSLGSGFDPSQVTQNSDGSISLGTAGAVTVAP